MSSVIVSNRTNKNKTKRDFILIKIEHILDNIKICGSEKLLETLENSENIEIIQNKETPQNKGFLKSCLNPASLIYVINWYIPKGAKAKQSAAPFTG